MLTTGEYDIPRGKVANIVTHLEMSAPADIRPMDAPEGVTVEREPRPDLNWYRDLFRRVGGHDWLWHSRLALDDSGLSKILYDSKVEVYAVYKDGMAQGLLELDFRVSDDCELAFFGLAAPLIGTGTGRFLMNTAITRAWSKPLRRFHVHTCTLDHPAALSFYRRSGFTPIRQQVEIEDDPRLTGALPLSAGPHIPIFSGQTG